VNIAILEAAEADIVAAYSWYESKREGLGSDFELCIEEALGRIIQNPEGSPIWIRNTRRFILTRFPYGVFYKIQYDTIYIVAIFSFKRNPHKIKSAIRRRMRLE